MPNIDFQATKTVQTVVTESLQTVNKFQNKKNTNKQTTLYFLLPPHEYKM